MYEVFALPGHSLYFPSGINSGLFLLNCKYIHVRHFMPGHRVNRRWCQQNEIMVTKYFDNIHRDSFGGKDYFVWKSYYTGNLVSQPLGLRQNSCFLLKNREGITMFFYGQTCRKSSGGSPSQVPQPTLVSWRIWLGVFHLSSPLSVLWCKTPILCDVKPNTYHLLSGARVYVSETSNWLLKLTKRQRGIK